MRYTTIHSWVKFLSFLSDDRSVHIMIGYWHDDVVCLSVSLSVRLAVSEAVHSD